MEIPHANRAVLPTTHGESVAQRYASNGYICAEYAPQIQVERSEKESFVRQRSYYSELIGGKRKRHVISRQSTTGRRQRYAFLLRSHQIDNDDRTFFYSTACYITASQQTTARRKLPCDARVAQIDRST